METTPWNALFEPHVQDIDGNVDCVPEYIRFCKDSTIPTNIVSCYRNSQLWVTSDLKALLNWKKRAFRAGHRAELKPSLRESKDVYNKKLEEKLWRNKAKDFWSGIREILDFRWKGVEGAVKNTVANELIQFFNRCDSRWIHRLPDRQTAVRKVIALCV